MVEAIALEHVDDASGCLTVPERRSPSLRAGDARSLSIARSMSAGSVPTISFVPSETVTGRSVLSRSVRQGTPSAVVSS